MASVGQRAPAWCVNAYVNGEQQRISSDQYAGRWHVLYWYPLDFTFVCPTEIRGFEALLDDFRKEGVEVVGASTDSYYSHAQWFADRKTFAQPITHPVVADTNHAMSRAFGVLKEDEGIAYRATVVVDDEGVVRSFCVNDLSVGLPAELAARRKQYEYYRDRLLTFEEGAA